MFSIKKRELLNENRALIKSVAALERKLNSLEETRKLIAEEKKIIKDTLEHNKFLSDKVTELQGYINTILEDIE